MNPEAPERFVDADEAAKFLSLTRRRVLDLARARKLPGHPIGEGARRVWRFRFSELAAAFVAEQPVVFTYDATHSNKLVKTVPGATE
jgi:Helix-turn-helix domain